MLTPYAHIFISISHAHTALCLHIHFVTSKVPGAERSLSVTCCRTNPGPTPVPLFVASSCIKLHQVASSCIKLHQVASSCIKLHQVASSCIKMHQVASRCIKLHQVASSCIKLHQVASSCIKLHQVASSCIKLHQVASSCIKLHQVASRCIKLHQVAESAALGRCGCRRARGRQDQWGRHARSLPGCCYWG